MSNINIYDLSDLQELVAEKDPRIQFRGDVWLDHKRADTYLCFEEYQGHNIIPTEGLNCILDTAFGGATQIATWYVGLFKGNYTPIATNTAGGGSPSLGAGGLFSECQDADYTPATNRPAFTVAAASGGVITNAASKAEFDMTSTITVYGAFLTSAQAKTSTSGKLGAAKKFDTSRNVTSGDILYVTYQLTATSS